MSDIEFAKTAEQLSLEGDEPFHEAASAPEMDVNAWEAEYVEPVPMWLKLIVLLSVFLAFSLLVWTYLKKESMPLNDSYSQEVLSLEDSLKDDELLGEGFEKTAELIVDTQTASEHDESLSSVGQLLNQLSSDTVATSNSKDIINDIETVNNAALITASVTVQAQSAGSNSLREDTSDNPLTAMPEKSDNSVKVNQPAAKIAQTTSQPIEVTKKKVASISVAAPKKTTNLAAKPKPPKVAAKSNYKYTLEFDNAALKAMSSSQWAVQLIGMNDAAGFETFVKSVSVNHSLYIYRRQRQGRMWHVAVLAPFDSRESAVAAVQQLPSKIRSNQPWVKSISAIKKQL